MMKNQILAYTLYILILKSWWISFAVAQEEECKIEAKVNCNITDTRAEFADYFGRPCKEFQQSYLIDKNKVADGGIYADGPVNENGYPLIHTVWTYDICNVYHSKIELKSWLKDTGAFFEGVKKKIYDDEGKEFGKGVLKPNECMNGVFETELDSEQRYHEGSVKASARLSPHKQNTPSVQCEAEANLLARFEYSDDCRVKASTRCILLNQYGTPTGIHCNDNIEYFEDDQCKNVRVRYEAEACNDENRRIEIERKLSKGKLNKKKFAKLQRYLGAGVCVTLIKDSVINTCDRTPKSLSMSITGRKGTIDSECKDYSFLIVKVKDPQPSAMPSESPSLSVIPTSAPSVSFNPSVSISPSMLPSASPTKRPSSSPSVSPTKNPSISPSDLPTRLPSIPPTIVPSVSPSAEPTASELPSLSPSKSVQPSDQPTSSTFPSSSPSISHKPTLSTQPSISSEPTIDKTPSDEPTVQPSKTPSFGPTGDGSPSSTPTEHPTGSPTECVDDPSWITPPDSEYSNLSCEDVTSEKLCDLLDEPPYIINGKGAKGACCECGGSVYFDVPTSQPSQCEDVTDWKDAYNLTCHDYMTDGLCGTSVVGMNGLLAREACCCCGGGAHVSSKPSVQPSMIPSNVPTVFPSNFPSSSPSICRDDTMWITVNEPRKGLACADVTARPDYCEILDEIVNGKSVNQACCQCGGSRYSTVSPTVSPTCVDVLGWIDLDNGTCDDYVTPNMCNTSVPGTNGLLAREACCNCNGGQHVANASD